MGTVHHGAMDVRYGLLVRHEDGSWHPYGAQAAMTRAEVDKVLEYPPYGLDRNADFRIVKWTALTLCPLCPAPDCKGHDDVDEQCPPLLAPKYPEGTPEYDAYANELRGELDKFAHGEI